MSSNNFKKEMVQYSTMQMSHGNFGAKQKQI